jgi:importin subunit alpha-1
MQLESLPEMIGGVWSEDKSLQLEATTHFRKLLSIGKIFMIEFAF